LRPPEPIIKANIDLNPFVVFHAKVFMQVQLTIVIGEMKNEGSSLLTLDSNRMARI
jgi:hypothetical protein